jgi:hypothetical protein
MRTKILIWIFALFLLAVPAMAYYDNASTDNNTIAYWRCDEGSGALLNDISGYNHDVTFNSGYWNTSGAPAGFNDTISCKSGVRNTIAGDMREINNLTIILWVHPTGAFYEYALAVSTTPSNKWAWEIGNDASLDFYLRQGAGAAFCNDYSNQSLISHTWQVVAVSRVGDGTAADSVTYFTGNGSQIIEIGTTECAAAEVGTNTIQGVGGNAAAGHYFKEFHIRNDTLNTSQILCIINSSTCSAAPPAVSNFTITAQDVYSSASLSNFSATIDSTTYTTTNGTIITHILSNSTSTWTVDVFNITDLGGYFNRSYASYNVSSDLTAELHAAEVILEAYELMTLTQLYGNFTINGTAAGSINNLSAGTYNFSFVNGSYYQMDSIQTVAALFNGTINISGVYTSRVNVSVFNAFLGTGIDNFTGWIYNANYSFNQSFNASSNTTVFNVTAGNYTLFVDHPDYSISQANYENVTINDTVEYYNFSLYSNNSIYMTIRDESTNLLITSNVTITIDGDNSSQTNYTSTGYFFIDQLDDGNYSIKFSADNYTVKTYTVTVAVRSTQSLTAYLSSEYETTILTILDDLSSATIEGVTIQMSRQINSTWTVVENKLSDVTGRGQFSYIPNIKYRFYLSMTGYQDKTFDLDPIIFSAYTIRLDRDTTAAQPWDFVGISLNYYPTIFYNNQTNNFTFVISSPDGALEEYGIIINFPTSSVNDSGTNSIGDQFEFSFNITDAVYMDTVNITFWYDTVFSDNKTFTGKYYISGFATGNYTFIANRQRDYGLGWLERVLISTMAAGMGAALGFALWGLVGALFMGVVIEGVAAYLGFIPVWAFLLMAIAGITVIIGKTD